MTTLAKPINTIASTTGCWSNFVSGAGKTVSWCGRQVANAGKAVWSGIQKVAALAVTFFKKIAFFCGIGAAVAITFVKAHASKFLIGGVCIAAGLAIGLLFSRICGCCNKPVKTEEIEDQSAAVQPNEAPFSDQAVLDSVAVQA